MNKVALGVHVGHDRGCSIVLNGMLIGSIAQERLDRVKYSESSEIPFESIDKLLSYHHLTIGDVDTIAITFSSILYKEEIETYYMDILKKYYKNYKCHFKVIFINHHLAHAACVYYTSPFHDAAIFIADGGGDFFDERTQAESLYLIENNRIVLKEQRLQDLPNGSLQKVQNYIYPLMNNTYFTKEVSLARKYEQITYMLGFRFGQSGKTMGLASYGKKQDFYQLDEGNGLDFHLFFNELLEKAFLEQQSLDMTYYEYITKNKENLAKTVQCLIEEKIISLIKYISTTYGKKQICLSGGLFLNCMLNHKILDEVPNIELFLTPACGDDGQSIGAAFEAYKLITEEEISHESALPYLGFAYNNKQILDSIRKKGLSFTYFENDDELIEQLSELLSERKIIGFFRGRSEIGPRALCHRSILADPTWEGMKDYLNDKVKHREWFRPFAPVVTEDMQFEIFDLKQSSPYMLFATSVKEKFRDKIPSVVHIDGSARIQSVSEKDNKFLFNLLKKFEEIKGVPVLLNTSFNDNGEPIVESPDDAIFTFLNTNIDVLVMENYMIMK